MDFEIRFLSFYVIQVEGKDEQANKQFKHFQTLDTGEFEESEPEGLSRRGTEKNRQTESRPPSAVRAGADENRPFYR